ncbi:MAG: SH3 domain-containing protein [Desulfobulbaceae bacterium]|nr:SH3 domain-containing protein [Desulfobulbaceae bacterium]
MSKSTDYIKKMIDEQDSPRKKFEASNPVQKMIDDQESLRKRFEVPNYVQQMIDEQDSFRKKFEVPNYVQKMIDEHDSLRKKFEASNPVQKMIDDQESLRKRFEAPNYVQKMIDDQESLRKRFEIPNYVKKMLEEQEVFREIFATRGSATTAMQSLISQGTFNPFEVTKRIKSLADELSLPEFYRSNNGLLSFEEPSINVTELSIAVNTFFKDLSEDSSIDTVLSRLACLKKPVQRIAIWIFNYIIMAYIVNVMVALSTPSLQTILDSIPLKSRQQVTRTIKKLPLEIGIDEYKGYRVVTTEILNLRQNPNMKSYVIMKLKRGKLVRVIQKKKNWTKVEVENSDSYGAQIGWVTTRYIVPFSR